MSVSMFVDRTVDFHEPRRSLSEAFAPAALCVLTASGAGV